MTNFDWTPMVCGLITVFGTFLAAAVAHVWQRYIRPWMEQKGLGDAAEVVVNAVETLLGRYTGEEKWLLALEKIGEYGYDMDHEAVLDALRAAWQKLNLEQIAAGVKEAAGGEKETA